MKPKYLDCEPRFGEVPQVLYEDEHLFVVSKPSGWLTHEDHATERPSVTQWHQAPLGIHGRLDVDTTGVLIFSKDEIGHRQLSRAYQSRSIIKRYLAVTLSKPSPSRGEWIDTMPDRKSAHLRFECIRSSAHGHLVSIQIETGRTHQIRYQFAKHGCPLMGDPRYGDPFDRRAPRTLLHCSSITLPDGRAFETESPDDFALALGRGSAAARSRLAKSDHTNAYRVYNGEADGHPGWIVDRYGDFAWIRQDAGSSEGPQPTAAGVYGLLAPKDRSKHANPGAVHLKGAKTNGSIWVRECGREYSVQFDGERSTGIFLDQRPQRAWLAQHSQGLEILNTFAHAGAFAVATCAQDATSLNLDLSRKWLSRIPYQIERNGGTSSHHPFLTGDVFEWLPRLSRQGRQFDLVILDPPSTSVGKKRKRWSAGNHYAELATLAAPLIKPGGLLWTCTNHKKTLPRAFAKRVRVGLTGEFELERVCPQAVDHPTLGPPALKVLVWRKRG